MSESIAQFNARLRANRIKAEHEKEVRRRALENGFTHGERDFGVEPPDEFAQVVLRADAWTDDDDGITDRRTWLLRRAALISVRLDRSAERELNAVAESVRKAVGKWTRRQRTRARQIGMSLAEQPARVVEALRQSAFGCDWLIGRMGELARTLDTAGHWNGGDLNRALNLMGEWRSCPTLSPAGRDLWRDQLASAPKLDCNSADAYFGEPSTSRIDADRLANHRARLPVAPAALARLRARVADYLAEVRALRDRLWAEVDRPRRDEVARLARFDGTADADALHRHEARLDAQLHRAFREADRLRRAADSHSAATDQPSRSILATVGPDPLDVTLELEAARDDTTSPDEVRSPSVHGAFAPGSPTVAEASANALQYPSSLPSNPHQAARPIIATSRETRTSDPKPSSIKVRPLSVHELLSRPHLWKWRGRLEWLPGTTTEGWPVVKGKRVSPWIIHEPRHAPWHRAEAKPQDASAPHMPPEPSRDRPAHLEDRNHGRINPDTPLK
jgi:hypothetical protein